MNKFLGKIGGRKFILAVFMPIAIALSSAFGISETVIMTIGGIVATYIGAQGVADGLSGGATSTTTPDAE